MVVGTKMKMCFPDLQLAISRLVSLTSGLWLLDVWWVNQTTIYMIIMNS